MFIANIPKIIAGAAVTLLPINIVENRNIKPRFNTIFVATWPSKINTIAKIYISENANERKLVDTINKISNLWNTLNENQ